MNVLLKLTNDRTNGRYFLVSRTDRSWSMQEDETRFLCKGIGDSDKEARAIGFWSFVDGFVAPDNLAMSPLADCKFRRSGSFERVGRYLGAVMQESEQVGVE